MPPSIFTTPEVLDPSPPQWYARVLEHLWHSSLWVLVTDHFMAVDGSQNKAATAISKVHFNYLCSSMRLSRAKGNFEIKFVHCSIFTEESHRSSLP